ncbi:hypothetical protein [Maricaulis sp.]|uniref:hypothetical protein n=1 Tax=Maricaulis sp. TaxID=1486257 RepID=UPI00261916B4|nr:hypothetical protein [Maricaulis sp.]
MNIRFLACTSLIALMATPAVAAQDWDAPPAYGRSNLEAGFADDPRSIAIQAGGAIDASALSPECYGYITHQPSHSLDYEAGAFSLYISAASDMDGVLVVRAPDGSFHCNDDAPGLGLHPGVEFTAPMSGEYDIWAGSLGFGSGYEPGELHISEISFFDDNRFSRAPEASLPPNAGRLSLSAGFAEDPQRLAVQAGGDVDAGRTTSEFCWGRVSQAPDVWIDYQADEAFDLYLSMEADEDTTLVVQGPDGVWSCDDDTAGDFNPGVRIRDPQSGRYAVWAGRYSPGPLTDATLFVSELGFRGDTSGPPQLDWTMDPNYGSVELDAGFTPDPHTVPLMAGGDQDVWEAVGENCRGFATRAPDYDLNYTAGGYDLYVSATSDNDATLIINAPDGTWWCDDDSAGNLNPGVHFDAPQSGLYNIWVGTFSEGDLAPAELHVSELAFGNAYADGAVFDLALPAEHGEIILQSGFDPDPVAVDVRAGGGIAADAGADGMCRGYANAAPDYQVTFEAGNAFDLYIYAQSEGDTTLTINDPNGNWVCNDDQEGFDPGIAFENPSSGVYDIWVGSYWEGADLEARLFISELGFTRSE